MISRLRSVCLFCGSAVGSRPEYARAATDFGALLAQRGLRLIYGGGCVGLMGVAADAALRAGGEVVGVIPEFLRTKELCHEGLTELIVVDTMHARKARMAELAEAFVALPGGFGTLDELCEILTWAQLGLHRRPIGLLNVGGYFDGLIAQLDRAVAEGFCRAEHRDWLLAAADVAELLRRLEAFEPPRARKWLSSEQV